MEAMYVLLHIKKQIIKNHLQTIYVTLFKINICLISHLLCLFSILVVKQTKTKTKQKWEARSDEFQIFT